ncbi:coiled-coil domain-containing protein 66 [Chanos chanos]|uniref:Coiled-coil domain-containing protein 66 n=1 Tax=Chanos chanos TaxID=29144 RepID=A0A6J2VSG1_CHACN|nr:coiled-coil domain-containing protein 66 [Chanos chanos]
MNLGDGLMFELENGKPRLILTNYGAETKISTKIAQGKRIPQRNKPQKVSLNKSHKQGSRDLHPERPIREKKYTEEHEEQLGFKKSKVKGTSDSNTKAVARVRSARKAESGKTTTTDGATEITQTSVKDSLVCLTQEQLQQILSTINKTSALNASDGSNTLDQTGSDAKGDYPLDETEKNGSDEALIVDTSNHVHQTNHEKGAGDRMVLNGTKPGLFSTFGEREREREALEAKKAQWRKELDEQMALKQKQKAKAEVLPDSKPWLRSPVGTSSQHSSRNGQVSDERMMRAATGTGDMSCQSAASQTYSSQRDLPAAIRSAFVLGEATPMEHAFNAEKKEQQRRWLQHLDQQREEARQRKQQEKQEHSQAEDHERWAMHFDSLQKRLTPHPPLPPASDRGDPESLSSLSHHRSASGAVSAAWDGMSAFGGDSLGRASVDTTRGFTQKSSYLRTMTALLDPAQIEERERKRLKQLEHQRAIEAQVEERRRQREKEEAARQALEEEEERRLAREREHLQQKYLLDTQQQRQKEELLSRKTEELYLSVQRAQEEALKDKHLQRIQDLARKGHDVSKLLHSLKGESSSTYGSLSPSPSLARSDAPSQRTDAPDIPSPRKDTAVQTEVNTESHSSGMETLGNMDHASYTPDIPTEYQASLGTKKSKRGARPADRKQSTGKENVCTQARDDGGDPYEAYARTDRRQQGGKRPEWNTRKPSKPFVPASERYPPGLQQHRQESRMRRQMELMTLVEKNTLSRMPHQNSTPPVPLNLNLSQQQWQEHSPHQKDEGSLWAPSTSTAVSAERVCSPPIPTLKHHHLQHSTQLPPCSLPEEGPQSAECPSSSDYVPYVRTDEVYHLDPLAPLSRPSTQEPQKNKHTGLQRSRQGTPLAQKDPLLHPELLKSTERQQAILKGLSELRQGLLQKQRELETNLNPLLLGQARNPSLTFQNK